jgi:hypothetical protein
VIKHILLKVAKIFGIALLSVIIVALLILAYVNLPVKTPKVPFTLGMTFSWVYSEEIGLDWQEVYTAMLDDLTVRKIRVPVYWHYIEETEGEYRWDRLDWQVAEAEKRDAKLTIAMGRKVPRWPECFIPEWAKEDTEKRQEHLLLLIQETINRYKDSPAVERWQIENEPFLAYGHCPPFDIAFFDRELAVAREADPTREILTTDSGELSLWIPAAARGDVFGTTMYRNVYTQEYGAWEYPVGPRFFQVKKWLAGIFSGQDDFIVIELQGEPWLESATVDFPIEDQLAHTDADRVVENVNFARQGGFTEIYLWGVEWWYWVMKNHDNSSLWDTARSLYNVSR